MTDGPRIGVPEHWLPVARYLGAIDDATERVARSSTGDLSRPVVACPGWTVADVLWHLIEVHGFWRQVVADGADPSRIVRIPRPVDDELSGTFRRGATLLVDALRITEPSKSVWTWTGPQPAAWVMRRMAHETAMHALDVVAAAGSLASDSRPFTPDVAADGIDEFLSTMLAIPREGRPRPGGTVHLHCTDVAGEWMIDDVDGSFVVTREHGKGSCALRGPATSILAVLWRRAPLTDLELFGDAMLAERFIDLADLG